ncbi:MAG: hypothetical protein GY814_13660 [Gammaproteobacteria bacterium]|nr:hypothetical protein [Gammaproteobacteria bacterium]
MFATETVSYLSERILTIRVGLIWLMVLVCLLLTAAQLPWLAVASAMFILAFRLWDDLADLTYDRQHHPLRCLVRSVNLKSFHVAQWTLLAGLAGMVQFIAGGTRALIFLGLVMAFFAIYSATTERLSLRSLRVILVVAKYPAFILLLSLRPGDSFVLIVALAAYLLPLLDEVRSSGPRILIPAVGFVGLSILVWLVLNP